MSGSGKHGRILVIGGGISGITAAIEASEAGPDVVLVENSPCLGGRVAQMNQYFPKLCPPSCGLEINLRRIRTSPQIRCFTTAEDEYNYGMSSTKAIYLPFDTAYPMQFAIDDSVCLGTECGKCVPACPYQAIDLDMEPNSTEMEVQAVIWATGWEPFDAAKIEGLGFGEYPNVITNVMMERLASPDGPTAGKIQRPSDGKEIETIAFVQCAGSRDENYLKYCSGVCCMGSLKQARYIREQYPDAQIYIFYIDVRAPGRQEDFYAESQKDEKLQLVKGKVAKISQHAASGNLVLEAEDTLSGDRVSQEVNMVVLATGIVPVDAGVDIELDSDLGDLDLGDLDLGGLQRDEHGFLTNDQPLPGLLGAGCAKRPVDVASCVRDATGVALKALQSCVEQTDG
jgi:quinone-modifying oxidoreductase subunit QmoA